MRLATAAYRDEMLQLMLLLVLDGFFYFMVIPAGIVDPEAFSMDQGLPPSFSARLVALLAGALLLGRLVQLLARGGRDPDSGTSHADPESGGEPVTISVRSVAGIAAAMLFAGILVPTVGFLAGGAVLLLVLLAIMGERRALRLATYPAIVMLMVWLLFEKALSIRLPVGTLFAQ